MTKTQVDNLIANMKKAAMVTKVSPWSMEAIKDIEYHVRYVGLKVSADWLDIFSGNNNLLIKFSVSRKSSKGELFLANFPPFTKIINLKLSSTIKWEVMLGDVKNKLKKDKADFLKSCYKIDNLYAKVKDQLR